MLCFSVISFFFRVLIKAQKNVFFVFAFSFQWKMLGKMGLVKAIFNIGFSILRTLLFGVPTLIFKQVKATSSKVFKGALSGLRLFGN